MRQPTDKEISEAKQFLISRLNAEQRMVVTLRNLLHTYTKRLVSIAFKYHIPANAFSFQYDNKVLKEVEDIIDELIRLIEFATETCAFEQAEDDEIDNLRAYLNRETHGNTFKGRVYSYVTRFVKEIETVTAAGLFNSKSEAEIISSINTYIERPYANEQIASAIKSGSTLLVRLRPQMSYGVGRTNSSYTGLSALTEYAIAETWMYLLGIHSKKRGSQGYWVMRGSSYPCATCDDNVGFHSDWDALPLYHSHCKCIAVPISSIF